MDNITILGFTAAFLSTFSLIPQLFKILKTKQTRDLSLFMFLVSAVALTLWATYGILRGDIVLIISNIVMLSVALTIIFLKIKHG